MKTYRELKAFAEKNNVKFEVNPIRIPYEYFDIEAMKHVTDYIEAGYYFGLNNIAGRSGASEWQWVWYKTTDREITDDSMFFFEERYSMVNGKAYHGVSEMLKAEMTIDRRS